MNGAVAFLLMWGKVRRSSQAHLKTVSFLRGGTWSSSLSRWGSLAAGGSESSRGRSQ